jgi:DNA-binding CsgD family transcriptional regulator
MLVGRDSESRLIESLLEDARRGTSASLVLRGEPGIGKSALLEHAAASGDLRTLRCAGVASEHDLAFAGLEQLLRPLHALIERLPAPQAAALRSALGISEERAEDRLLLGIATLNLLAEASDDGPLLCLIDDLQWIDEPSAQAMLFTARRLGAEGVVMLFSIRDDPGHWFDAVGLRQLSLAPLADAAARQVVSSVRRASLRPEEEVRLLREARGNPLALLELPLEAHRDGGATGLDAAFRARVAALSHQARFLLLLAATGEADEARSWRDLAALADTPPETIREAVEAGLVGDLDSIVFRHPLARAAVYSAASATELAEAHRLLSAATSDPIARALHLAAASSEPDETLAGELERAASVAARRGGFASAAGILVRAVELSLDRAARRRRLIAAAHAYLDAGNLDAAARLADQALPEVQTASEQAALAIVRGALELQRGTPAAAYELLLSSARAVASEEPRLALEVQAQAMTPAFVAGWPERAFTEAHELLRTLPPSGRAHEPFLRAFLGMRAFLGATAAAEEGARDEARAQLAEAVTLGSQAGDFRLLVWVAIASAYLGDLHSAGELSKRAVALARAAGSFETLPIALLGCARVEVNASRHERAEDFAREGIELTSQLAQENLKTCLSAILVRCRAARGDVEECRELAEATLARALAHGLLAAADDVRIGVAELELSLGNGGAALEALAAVSHPLFRLVSAPLRMEASMIGGANAPDAETLEALDVLADHAQDPERLGVLARARALLSASPELAESLLLEALSYQREQAQPFDRARTELAYGEALRRARRRTQARVQLRSALATFEGLGTPRWAERARQELEATGITARRRDPSTLDTLTPQELRIARLVAEGATNRDVAGQLYLSPKTVEYHLRKVYLKLGVSSRVELARQPLASAAGD